MAAPVGRLRRAHLHGRARPGRHRRPGFLAGELHRPENIDIARRLDVAISGGLRPTTLLLRVQPNSEWDELDFVLYEAHAVWKLERSQQSGWPLWLTRSADPRIGWTVETMEDAAERALDEWDERNQGKKRKKGLTRFAVPVADDESLLYGGLSREHHLQTVADLAAQGGDSDPSADLPEEARPTTNAADYGLE